VSLLASRRKLKYTWRRHVHAPDAQGVTFVELFFDLVFVFAVTQVTVLTVEHLTLSGVARTLLLFWLIWWAWTQFTWTLNPADTSASSVRAATLAATATAFVMAASVTRAFGDEAMWFVVPYLLVRVIGLALQVRVDLERPGVLHGAIFWWVGLSCAGLALVLAGGLASTPERYWLWVAAIVADLIAASAGGTRHEWDINPSHFAERHGLFVIIALGESLIVAATAVSGDARTGALIAVAAAGLLVACLLWWTYFAWLIEVVEDGLARTPPRQVGSTARDAFSLSHFPLVFGIIGFAVALEEMAHHPAAVPPGKVTAALGVGTTLYVASAAFAVWRASKVLLVARLVVLTATMGVLALASGAEAAWQLGIVAAGLLVISVVEGRGSTQGDSEAATDERDA
jgi:low temperature requirement protein LtrA